MRLFIICFLLMCCFCYAEESNVLETKRVEIIKKEYLDTQYEAFVEVDEMYRWLKAHMNDYINGIYPYYNKEKKKFDGYIVYFQKKNPHPIIIIVNGRQLSDEEVKEYLAKEKNE